MAARRRDRAQRRLGLLLILFMIGLTVIAVRLVYVQQVQAAKLSAMAVGQRLREIEIAGERGPVYDRNGQDLAINVDAASVYATPYLVKDARSASFKLAPILGLKPSAIEKKLEEKSGFVYLTRQLDMEKVTEVKKLKLPGINFLPERKRLYPNGELAAHVLGFSGVDNQGLAGIECYYDDILKGKPGKLIVEGDPSGAPIPGGIYYKRDATEGEALYLTIDKDIQYRAEEELKKVITDYSAKGGSVIVMDPKTGEILALASAPSYNPNDYDKATEAQLMNRAIAQIYEPGSTAKIITAAAAVEEKACGLEEVFSLPAAITVGGQTFGEYDGQGKGNITISGIIAQSSNVGAIELGLRLGKEKLYDYLKAFGLGEVTGVDLTGEEAGIVPTPDAWSETSIATIPYGQGISVTTLQMLNAVAAVANDGVKPMPHVLKRVAAKNGESKPYKEKQAKSIDADTAAVMQNILVNAVENGTGKNARIPGYEVGGKTGTAQKSDETGYGSGKVIVSFAGYVSNLEPQLVIIVTVDEPQATGPQPVYAATIAAPVFRDIAEFSINRLKIAPGSRARQ